MNNKSSGSKEWDRRIKLLCDHGEEMRCQKSKQGSVMIICLCGIVVGYGSHVERLVKEEISTGKANRLDAEPGTVAMLVTSVPRV